MSVCRRRLAATIALPGLIVAVLAACGGSQAPAAPSAAPSDPPRASSSASPSAAVSPSGDPDAGAALDAFKAFVQTQQSFHVQGDLRLRVGAQTVHMDIQNDIGDGDEHANLSITTGGAGIRMEIILLDGTAYAKIARREWEEIPIDVASTNPLAALAIDGLEPAGRANVAGQLTHVFRTDDPGVIQTSAIAGPTVTELSLETASFEVYVTDDGVPLIAIMKLGGSGTFEGATESVEAEVRYDFSRFGEPVVIEAPI